MKSMNMSTAGFIGDSRDLIREAQDGIQRALGKLDLANLEESIMMQRNREVQVLYIWGQEMPQMVTLE